jgi:5-methylcytosine-specific restriction endonuclease McrA
MPTKYKPRPLVPKKYFEDPRWRAKRKIIMERDNWRCQSEGGHAGDLIVHHRNYTTSEPWNELDENLITLCEKHHQAEHDDLGSAASAVANVLKHSNWMVKHRKVLIRCIEEKSISPEELTAFIEKRFDKGA